MQTRTTYFPPNDVDVGMESREVTLRRCLGDAVAALRGSNLLAKLHPRLSEVGRQVSSGLMRHDSPHVLPLVAPQTRLGPPSGARPRQKLPFSGDILGAHEGPSRAG